MNDKNGIQTIKNMVKRSLWILETTFDGTTTELLNKVPTGETNPIGAVYLHALINLDVFYNEAIRGGKLLLVSGGQARALGVSAPENVDWDALKGHAWDRAEVDAYASSVRDAVNAYLETLDENDLTRPIQLYGQDSTIGDTITLSVWHTAFHAGEIAALKGINGAKGLPF